jgi:N-formylmaleamate deformylase
MPNWLTHTVSTNGIRLHYMRTGGDKPPVLLAHGLTDNGLCWTPLVQMLASNYDCIMVDARGHGRSDVPDAGYTDADHAADYAGVIQALGLDRPAMLGHSMGAATTAFLAAHYPDLVRAIALEDPPWRSLQDAMSPATRATTADEWRADLIAKRQRTQEQLLASIPAQQPTWSAAEYGPWAQAKLQVSPNVIDYVRIASPHWTEYVAQIDCPVLLLIGDVTLGAIVSPAVADEVSALNPNVRVAHIAGAGHSIRREQLAPYVQAVRDFLAQVYA